MYSCNPVLSTVVDGKTEDNDTDRHVEIPVSK